jgi:hypothetical protein
MPSELTTNERVDDEEEYARISLSSYRQGNCFVNACKSTLPERVTASRRRVLRAGGLPLQNLVCAATACLEILRMDLDQGTGFAY